jgi:phosphate starvation-inducible PhoH-like protein
MEETQSVIPFPMKKSRVRKTMDSANEEYIDSKSTHQPLVCKTPAQKRYLQAMMSSDITFCTGIAGCGKTYVSLKFACELLEKRLIERIIVTRPAVGVEEDLGALPGEVADKCRPWFQPALDVLNAHFGASHVEGMCKVERIKFVPMAYLRGLSFKNSFILLDEAQNATPRQIMTLMTRMDQGSKLVIDGDPEQCDLRTPSGLHDAIRRLQNVEGISFCTFDLNDIQRHKLVRDIILAYRNP